MIPPAVSQYSDFLSFKPEPLCENNNFCLVAVLQGKKKSPALAFSVVKAPRSQFSKSNHEATQNNSAFIPQEEITVVGLPCDCWTNTDVSALWLKVWHLSSTTQPSCAFQALIWPNPRKFSGFNTFRVLKKMKARKCWFSARKGLKV